MQVEPLGNLGRLSRRWQDVKDLWFVLEVHVARQERQKGYLYFAIPALGHDIQEGPYLDQVAASSLS